MVTLRAMMMMSSLIVKQSMYVCSVYACVCVSVCVYMSKLNLIFFLFVSNSVFEWDFKPTEFEEEPKPAARKRDTVINVTYNNTKQTDGLIKIDKETKMVAGLTNQSDIASENGELVSNGSRTGDLGDMQLSNGFPEDEFKSERELKDSSPQQYYDRLAPESHDQESMTSDGIGEEKEESSSGAVGEEVRPSIKEIDWNPVRRCPCKLELWKFQNSIVAFGSQCV